MDSLTQIVLGAAVGEFVAGKQLGNKAILFGALAGTLPDLDILFYPLLDPIDQLSFHRGPSHSFAGIAVASPMIAWLLFILYRKAQDYSAWLKLFFWGMITHPMLDAFTTYGTSLFWPFSDFRVYHSSIFVADLTYTLPFLAFVIWAWRTEQFSAKRRKIAKWSMVWGIGFIAFTVINKSYVTGIFKASLKAQGLDSHVERLITAPTPLNQLLWYGVAETDSSILLGYHSHLDESNEVQFREIKKHSERLAKIKGTKFEEKLLWFSDGFYRVYEKGDTLFFDDLRFGSMTGNEEENIHGPFRFSVFPNEKGELTIETLAGPNNLPEGDLAPRFSYLLNRIAGYPASHKIPESVID